jgi:hypothetical protein
MRPLWFLAAVLAAALAGCGADNGLTLGRVRGKVTFKGEPIRYGTVFLMPDDAKGTKGPPAMATISADGTFTVSTDEPGDGAIVGEHKVGVVGLDPTPIKPEEKEPPPPNPETDPQGFLRARAKASMRRPRASTAKVETFTDRGGRVYKYVIPKALGDPRVSGLAIKVERGSNTMNIVVRDDGTAEIAR